MLLQSRKVHSGHDLLPPSAAGEVSRAAAAAAALFLALVDLTKAFDSVSRSGLFKILQKISCPPTLLAIITSFHQDLQSTVCFDGATSSAFPVSSGVKQDCVLCSNPVWDFLLDAAPVCHCRLYRRCLRPDEVKRQTLQHRQTPRQNQS